MASTMLSRLGSKLKKFHSHFIAPPKRWRLPPRCDVLIYNAAGADALLPFLIDYRVEIIDLHGEFVNLPCLLRAALKPGFWRGQPIEAYVDATIEAALPKVVMTFIDNDPGFYAISRRLPSVKTLFVQNGMRGGVTDLFAWLERSPKYHVDYMLVFNAAFGRAYQQHVSGEACIIGSFKNNAVEKTPTGVDDAVLFLSQYRDRPVADSPFLVGPDGSTVQWDQFYEAERCALKFMGKWCAENQRMLRVAGCMRDGQGGEREFYASLLQGYSWEFVPRADAYGSYRLVDSAQIVVFIDSALGFESIGRGKKTAGFSCRGTILNDESLNFGWPALLPPNGPFWTNELDEKQFRRVMDYLVTVSDAEWEQTRQRHADDLMAFDAGNTIFAGLLKRLVLPSEISGNVDQ